jgi:predicted O-methyltransferase YrrM
MNFTEDWFTHNIPNFEKCMATIGTQRENFLEIGSYEGRSTCWLLQNGLDKSGIIACIDSYSNMSDVEQRFWENIKEVIGSTQSVHAFKEKSYQALGEMIKLKDPYSYTFDFIYIDGDHNPATTLTDACMAWGLLRSGGVMIFDDYLYPHAPTKIGIDAFLTGFAGHYDIIVNNYQLAVQKK